MIFWLQLSMAFLILYTINQTPKNNADKDGHFIGKLLIWGHLDLYVTDFISFGLFFNVKKDMKHAQ